MDKTSNSFSVYKDNMPVGAINLFINDHSEGWLQVIFIHYDYWNQGIGQIIWSYVEQKYTQVKVWRLQTPGYSRRNHNFYVNKCGFKIIQIIEPNKKNRPYPGFYLFEKKMNEANSDITAIVTRMRKSG